MLENKKQKQVFFAVISVFLLALLSVGGFWVWNRFVSKPTDTTPPYSGPTQQEAQAGNDAKEAIIDQTKEDQQKDPESTSSTEVNITYAAFAENVADINTSVAYYGDGRCVVTFKKGALTFAKTVEAYKDFRSTICTNPKVSRSEFKEAGEWRVVVSYSSADGSATGTSSEKSLSIP